MSVIHVCSLADLPSVTSALRPTHMVSLLSDVQFPDTPESVVPGGHLKLQMHDIWHPQPGCIAPAPEHLESLLDFARRWQRSGPLIIHCLAGVSRSTAAALVVLCCYNGGREREAVRLLRERAPHAYPNRLIIELADELMACDGRLLEAVDTMPGPDFLAPLRNIELPASLD